jgi:biotin transport system substrate-specific component
MTTSSAIRTPAMLISTIKKHPALATGFKMLGGVFLLAFASQLTIPLVPVPLTFQSSAVILIAMLFGARLGAYTVLAYLAAGFCGLPVFAEFSAGPMHFVGPTAGYLAGFVPAARVMSLPAFLPLLPV